MVDLVWPERPPRPTNKVFPLDVKYSGKSHVEKIEELRKELKTGNHKAMVVTMLDEVAWLLNLRGSDIDYNPVFFAYVIVTDDKAVLFVNPSQVDDSVRHSLGDFVQILPYDSFFPYLKGLATEVQFTKEAVSNNERRENSFLIMRIHRVFFSVTSQV